MCRPALVIQTVNLRLVLATSQQIMCSGMSLALPGSAAPHSVVGYVPSGSTDPEPQLLYLSGRFYRLQSR